MAGALSAPAFHRHPAKRAHLPAGEARFHEWRARASVSCASGRGRNTPDTAGIDGAAEYDAPNDTPLWRLRLLRKLVHHTQAQSGAVQTWASRRSGALEAYTCGGSHLPQRRLSDPVPNRMVWAQTNSYG
ncbi:hypothetical protein KO516_04410 [Citreicella sp. C3M06]|uniref:hypothetical protein n=1 Tax=Citreicella sp. C3M06 TaxID=2841564 RepID=UPI001C09F2D4|nr:hypothetical protein [Citreicella sp. C3M06]MBU2960082.1 hypothetical protein [Citreicella sp. C3M06]